MMNLDLVHEQGVTFIEGQADAALLASADDSNRVIEACFGQTNAALLYAANLPPAFFDLSSGMAGVILQKLSIYHIRLALVCPPGSVRFSSRFSELLADARGGSAFAVFATRQEAIGWLSNQGS